MFVAHTYVYIGYGGREKLNSVATKGVLLREGIHLVQHHVIHLTGKGIEEEQRIWK